MKLVVRHTFLELEPNRSSNVDRPRAKSDSAAQPFKFDGTDWQENEEEARTELGTEVATNSSPDSGLGHQRLRQECSSDSTPPVLLPDCCLLNDPDHAPDDVDDREVVELAAATKDHTGNSRTWTVPAEADDFTQIKTMTPSWTPQMAHTNSMVTRTPLRTPGTRTPGSRTRRKGSDSYRQFDAAYAGNGVGLLPPWMNAGQMPMPGMPLPNKVGLDPNTHAAELEVQAAHFRLAAAQAEAAAQQARQVEKSPKEASPHNFPAAMNPWMMYPQMPPPFSQPHPGMPPFVQAVGMPPGWPGAPWPHYVPPAWPTAAPIAAPETYKSGKEKKTYKPQSWPKDERDFTTVMLRNLPNDYSRDMLLELLDSEGFAECYDFVYLPIDFKKQAGLGYAFLNLLTHDDAERLRTKLQGFSGWKCPTQKVLQVSWSQPLQGLAANIERYKNSPVMHQDVPEHFKPLLFKDGQQVLFPQPAKRIRPPATQ